MPYMFMKTKQIGVGGINCSLVRSNRKTVGIQIGPGGEVTVRAPLSLPEAEIRTMVTAKILWIEKTKVKIAERESELKSKPTKPPFSCADGETLPYLGGALTVAHREDACEPRAGGGTLILPAGMGTGGLVLWLKRRAAEELNARLDKYAPMIGVRYRSARLSDARTRWGMCSGKNSINLSWRLIFCPPEAIDYVVAHELCHVKHKNHSGAFHAELESLIPGCGHTEKWFKENAKLILLL